MDINSKKFTLILSKQYVPLGIEGVKKTMSYLIHSQGKALDPETYETFTFDQWINRNSTYDCKTTIRTEKLWIMIPEIVVLNTEFNPVKKKSKSIKRKRVYERDNHRCVYCNVKLVAKNRTIDHVHPTSKNGSKTDYRNVVAACGECNSVKSNTLLEELYKTGPHKTDEHGNILVHREKRWKLDLEPFNPDLTNHDIMYHIPKEKWLSSWFKFTESTY